MKRLLILVLLLMVAGCAAGNQGNSLKVDAIKGYWVQVENDRNGEVTDLSNNKYAYLEITDKQIIFHTYYEDTDTSGFSDRFYKLEGNQLYYATQEMVGSDWKDKIDAYGGVYEVSLENGKLVLLDKIDDDEFEKQTYEKVEVKDWPIKE